MPSETAVIVGVTLISTLSLEAGCKSISGGVHFTFVAVNIPHPPVYEAYREWSICGRQLSYLRVAVSIPRSLVQRMPAMNSIIGSFDQILNLK
jgi:hypothetical protein